jgi:uncharacterized protein (DUF1800 family)
VAEPTASALPRRRLLAAGGAALAVGAAAVASAAPAEAAGALAPAYVTKRVRQQVPLKWTYNARTKVTTVTKYRFATVTARFSGATVLMKNAKGAWVRVPYVWSARRKMLVYSRALQLALIAAAKPPAAKPTTLPPDPVPAPASSTVYLSSSQARHVLRRAGYGPSTTSLAEVAALGGGSRWLERQLAPATVSDSACEAVLRRLPNQADPIWLVRDEIRNDIRSGWEQQQSVSLDFIVRAAFSKRQLQTVMEEFWANHFNVTVPHGDTDESRAHYQWTIRTRAMGTFAELLRAVTFHPAMLTYLNNRDSDEVHPNENHGRELLELHTVGVDAGYGETGVLNAARILTGLSVDDESGEYQYKPWHHWTGPVKVFAYTHPNPTREGGAAVAQGLITYLAHHPATAKRIAHKLALRFVSDTPSDALVASLAKVYLANGTAMVPVLRALFASPEFRSSVGRKTARPLESLLATIRVLDLGPEAFGVDAVKSVLWMSESVGHTPFGNPYPTGWADTADLWSSTASTLGRWNATRAIASNWTAQGFSRPDMRALVFHTTLPATYGAGLDAIAANLLGVTLQAGHKEALLTFLGKPASTPLTATSSLATWLLDDVVSLLLDSPYHHYR